MAGNTTYTREPHGKSASPAKDSRPCDVAADVPLFIYYLVSMDTLASLTTDNNADGSNSKLLPSVGEQLQALRQATVQLAPEQFLSHFPDCFIQYIYDEDNDEEKQKPENKNKALSTPHFDPLKMRQKQREGCGGFFSPNPFADARKIEKSLGVQAGYLDGDCAKEGDGTSVEVIAERKMEMYRALTAFRLRPHSIIDTKNGLHPIWKFKRMTGAEATTLFDEMEETLIHLFGADKGAKDITRVLRLPGSDHLKDPQHPYACTLILNELEREPYDLEEFVVALRVLDVFRVEEAPVQAEAKEKLWESGADGANKGSRNATAASITGKILGKLPQKLWETVGWGGLKEWNARNKPPIPKSELRSVFESIAKCESNRQIAADESGRNGRIPQPVKILKLVTNQNCLLFHDQFKEPHARFLIGDHWEIWKTRSKQFKRWLSKLLWETAGEGANSESLATALNVLDAKALYSGETITLHNRIAWHDGAILYDLGDKQCRMVRIMPEGWEIIENAPILFRRYSHQEEQIVPVKGDSLATLLPFVNLADKSEGILLLVYLVSCFLPDIPHPIPNLHGPQGSAKTTLARMLRRIIDPSKVEVLSFPSNRREFVQQLAHHYYAFFDNISDISDGVSDLLCRAVTGEGFSKRELYTDDEDIIYAFRRCIGLNGINPAAKNPDLLDRSILLKLERIPEESRMEEKEVLASFDAARPAILGAIFDALSLAMKLRMSVTLSRLPRMADFTRWGCAIAQALGYTQDEFLRVYYANIAEQHQEAIAENPVASAMREFIEKQASGEWEGTMSELLELLSKTAAEEKIDTAAREWPKAANILSRRLNEAKTNLMEIGITIRSEKAGHGRRRVLIQRVEENTADTAASPEGENGSQSIVDDVAEIFGSSPPVPPSDILPAEEEKTESGGSGDASEGINSLKNMGFSPEA